MKKLQQMAEALTKRPQLKLVIQGQYDPDMDGEALKRISANRDVIEQMTEKEIPIDKKPEMIQFDNVKTQRALEKRLEMVSGKNAMDDFTSQYEKSTGKKPEPVKPYLAIFGKGSADTDFYKAIFEELVKREPLNENDLVELGKRRAEAIVEKLIAVEGLDQTRVATAPPGPVKKTSSESVKTILTLEVINVSQ